MSSLSIYGGADQPLSAGGNQGALEIVAVLLTGAVYALLTYPSPLTKAIKSMEREASYSALLAFFAAAAPVYVNGASHGPIAQGSLGALMTGMMAMGALTMEEPVDARVTSIFAGVYGALYGATVKYAHDGKDEDDVNGRSWMTSWGAILVLVVAYLLSMLGMYFMAPAVTSAT